MALNDRSKIVDLHIEEEMKTSYINYSMSVIVSRALPDVRDGLKPSQRRILVAMNDLNLAPGRGYRKCAKIAGDTSGNYHPHGEGVLSGVVPNLLVNGCSGIAVGMATEVPPHNLREVCDAIITIIEKPETTPEELVRIVTGPDFPTGGIIYGTQGIRDCYLNGRGSM